MKQMEQQIIPRNDLVLIRLDTEAEKTSFILPDTMEKEEKAQGWVEALGSKVEDLNKGDKVIFGKFAGDDLEVEKIKYKLIKEEDILACLS